MIVPIDSKDEEAGKEAVLGIQRKATVMVNSSTQQVTFIAGRHEWSAEYLSRQMRMIYDFHIAESCENYSKMTFLRCGVDYYCMEL